MKHQVIRYVVSICQSKGMQTVFDFFGHLLFHQCFLEAGVTLFTMRSVFFSCCWCYEVQLIYSYISSRSSTDYLQVLNPKISCLIMSALNILAHIIPFYCMQTLHPKQSKLLQSEGLFSFSSTVLLFFTFIFFTSIHFTCIRNQPLAILSSYKLVECSLASSSRGRVVSLPSIVLCGSFLCNPIIYTRTQTVPKNSNVCPLDHLSSRGLLCAVLNVYSRFRDGVTGQG